MHLELANNCWFTLIPHRIANLVFQMIIRDWHTVYSQQTVADLYVWLVCSIYVCEGGKVCHRCVVCVCVSSRQQLDAQRRSLATRQQQMLGRLKSTADIVALPHLTCDSDTDDSAQQPTLTSLHLHGNSGALYSHAIYVWVQRLSVVYMYMLVVVAYEL